MKKSSIVRSVRFSKPSLEILEDRVTPAFLYVNTLADTISHADNQLSIREAVDTVNRGNTTQLSATEKLQVQGRLGSSDCIRFVQGGTIDLSQELVLNRNLIIQGQTGRTLDSERVVFDGQDKTRAVTVNPGVTATIQDLDITNGYSSRGGAIYNRGNLMVSDASLTDNTVNAPDYMAGGGAICNGGTMVLNLCTVENNSMAYGPGGGGIYNLPGRTLMIVGSCINYNTAQYGCGIYNAGGTLVMKNSQVVNNLVAQYGGSSGGGIYNSGGNLNLDQCQISRNEVYTQGGGIYTTGRAILHNCTLFANGAATGGGIYDSGYGTTLDGCTLNENYAVTGGGICAVSSGPWTLTNCTLATNYADSTPNQTGRASAIFVGMSVNMTLTNCTLADNLYGVVTDWWSTLTLNNTIVAGVMGQNIILGPKSMLIGSHSLVQNAPNQPGWLVGDPLLGPLQNNGGPTETMALLPGSPAIDAGDNALSQSAGVSKDQRGQARFVNGITDLGAYEQQPVIRPAAVTGVGGGGGSVDYGSVVLYTIQLSRKTVSGG